MSLETPPQDLNAEMSVLGSIMLDNRCIEEVMGIIDCDMFYSQANSIIYGAIQQMQSVGKPVDPVLLCEMLLSQKALASVGGAEYVATILESVPHAAHANYYSRIVREKAQQRRIIWKLKELTSELYEGMKPDLAVGELDRLCLSIGTGLVGETSVTLATAIDESDAYHKLVADGKIQVIGTGLPSVDQAFELGGMPGGSMGIIAARTSAGKTILGVQMAYDAAAAGVPAVVYTLEMRQRRVADRVLRYQARDVVRSQKLWLNDKLRDIRHICMDIRMHVRKHGVGLVLIDYLQLVRPANPKLDRRLQVEEISRALVELKNELDIVIIAAFQLGCK
jgi:replicative DNA helicase